MTAQNTDSLLEDAWAIVVQAENGFKDGEQLAEIMSMMDREELMHLVGRLASIASIAAHADGWEDLELKVAYMRVEKQ